MSDKSNITEKPNPKVPFLKLLAKHDSLKDSKPFIKAWIEWNIYRRETKHTLTKSTAKRQLNRFATAGPAVAVEMIDQSITNGWQGLFTPKYWGDTTKPVQASSDEATSIPDVEI